MNHSPPAVAYVMSRFPVITETFILDEMVRMENDGLRIEVYPLIRQRGTEMHREAAAMMDRTHFCPLFSLSVLSAQVYWLARRPLAYMGAWLTAVLGNLASPGFLARALVIVPKAAFMARHMLAQGVGHVHAHFATHPALAAYCVRRLAGISYSITVHAHDIYVNRTMLKTKLEAAEMVVTISEFNKKLLGNLYGDTTLTKTEVIRCGVDPSAPVSPRMKKEGRVPLIVCVASLQPYKGHRYLIEACGLMKKLGLAFRCLCIGGGKLRNEIERRIAAKNLRGNVRLLGPLPRRKVRRVVSAAAVFVLPSIVTESGKMEGIPVSLMEAMALGVPVVASNISGIPELVKDRETGLLVPEKDPASLADAIRTLLEDRELAGRLTKAGRRKVLAQYDQKKNIEQLQEKLTELLMHDGQERFELKQG